MGLFDAFKGELKLSKEEAAFGLLFVAVAADGEIDGDEQRAFFSVLARMRYFGRFDFDGALRKVSRFVRDQGVEAFAVAACEGLESHVKKSLFLNFLDLLISDGSVGPEEERLAAVVVEKLGIETDYVKNALAIISEKNVL
jgi:uncharacterized tellurite resistance protein B-like protein